MAIFGTLNLENTVQINDKTRLDGTKSFISTGEAAITLVRIRPEASGSFVTVTSDQYLDWSYDTAGTKVVTLEITTDGSAVEFENTITIISVSDDNLFSSDSDLVQHEDDLMSYLPVGRNSWLNKHRAAQDIIMAWLDEHSIWDTSGDRLTTAAIVNTEEVQAWSKYLVLKLIMESLSNQVDDIFSEKARKYGELMDGSRSRAAIRLDRDGDGTIDDARVDLRSGTLVRR